jgi:hypothetical protein
VLGRFWDGVEATEQARAQTRRGGRAQRSGRSRR